MEDLVRHLVEPIVAHPDDVQIQVVEGDAVVLLEMIVHDDDAEMLEVALWLKRHGFRYVIVDCWYIKPKREMRWEEVWDASTRIRSLLVNTPIPDPLHSDLQAYIETHFKDTPTVVRSLPPRGPRATDGLRAGDCQAARHFD
mgnify:CR=1 FL=1